MKPDVRDRVMCGIGAGWTVELLAKEAGVAPRTFGAWLAKGRKDPDGEYGNLARVFDDRGAVVEPGLSGAMTNDEFDLHLAKAIRSGDRTALKIFEDRRTKGLDNNNDNPETKKPKDPLAGVDELAAQRAGRR